MERLEAGYSKPNVLKIQVDQVRILQKKKKELWGSLDGIVGKTTAFGASILDGHWFESLLHLHCSSLRN